MNIGAFLTAGVLIFGVVAGGFWGESRYKAGYTAAETKAQQENQAARPNKSERRKSVRLRNALITGITVLMLTACANSTPPSVKSPPPADLAQPCPDLPELADTKGATLMLWALETVDLYQDCQAKHRGLKETP